MINQWDMAGTGRAGKGKARLGYRGGRQVAGRTLNQPVVALFFNVLIYIYSLLLPNQCCSSLVRRANITVLALARASLSVDIYFGLACLALHPRAGPMLLIIWCGTGRR